MANLTPQPLRRRQHRQDQHLHRRLDLQPHRRRLQRADPDPRQQSRVLRLPGRAGRSAGYPQGVVLQHGERAGCAECGGGEGDERAGVSTVEGD
jgi:hypothetical protein